MLDWDAHAHAIVTTSLHSFEGSDVLLGGRSASVHGPRLLADPQVGAQTGASLGLTAFHAAPRQGLSCWWCGRGAARQRCCTRNCLAILPAMDMDVLDEILGSAAASASQHQGLPSTVGNSYVLKLAKHGITDVRSCCPLKKLPPWP